MQDEEAVECSFVAYDALSEIEFTSCFEADAQFCQADLDMAPTFAPQPSTPVVSPTRAPVPRVTLPPLDESSAWRRSCLQLVYLLLSLSACVL